MATEINVNSINVIDDDPEFIIDPESKEITAWTNQLIIPQHSIDSERITFFVPSKIVEGHDLSDCTHVMIHYRNIEESTLKISKGIYEVKDLTVNDDGSVTLSWLVGGKATAYAGALIFSIHFASITDEGVVQYDFPTLTFSRITVGETVWNVDSILDILPNVAEELERRMDEIEKEVGNISAVLDKINGEVI